MIITCSSLIAEPSTTQHGVTLSKITQEDPNAKVESETYSKQGEEPITCITTYNKKHKKTVKVEYKRPHSGVDIDYNLPNGAHAYGCWPNSCNNKTDEAKKRFEQYESAFKKLKDTYEGK